jgi:outer membrane biosynthesis protein TonB
MEQSKELNALGLALSKAQSKIAAASMEAENPFFRSRYADLASIWEACRKPLSDNELAIIQTIQTNGKERILQTMLLHSSGQYIVSDLDLITTAYDKEGEPKRTGMQALGSAITYARRYALAAIVGIVAEEDDDAEAAEGRTTEVSRAHFCNIHKVAFVAFKKGDQTWYSHKIKGTETWCNEGKTEQHDVPIVKSEQVPAPASAPPPAAPSSPVAEPKPKVEAKKKVEKQEASMFAEPQQAAEKKPSDVVPAPTKVPPAVAPSQPLSDAIRDPASITDLGKLYTACYEDYGLSPAEVHKVPGVKARTEISEPMDEYLKVVAYIEQNPTKKKK